MIVKNIKFKKPNYNYNHEFLLSPTAKRVGIALLTYVINHPSDPYITYKDLSKLCNGIPHYHLEMDEPLGELSSLCKELGLPYISSVVYTQESGLPGGGFFKAFYPGVSRDKWMEIFIKCGKDVENCSKWKDLLNKIISQ